MPPRTRAGVQSQKQKEKVCRPGCELRAASCELPALISLLRSLLTPSGCAGHVANWKTCCGRVSLPTPTMNYSSESSFSRYLCCCLTRCLSREFSSKDLRSVGNYTLGRLIGKGSFGKVYLASHKLTNGSKVRMREFNSKDVLTGDTGGAQVL
jgi:hypothetical protein